MAMIYSNPAREHVAGALPDVQHSYEIWYSHADNPSHETLMMSGKPPDLAGLGAQGYTVRRVFVSDVCSKCDGAGARITQPRGRKNAARWMCKRVECAACDGKGLTSKREYAVPDVEVWEHHHPLTIGGKGTRFCEPTVAVFDEQGKCRGAGWYWQPAAPGVMADGGPGAHGPFDTEAEAIADAQCAHDGDWFLVQNDPARWQCGQCLAVGLIWPAHPIDSPLTYPGVRLPEVEELPPCVLAMRCYCAGHARGNPASAPCDTNESTNAEVQP